MFAAWTALSCLIIAVGGVLMHSGAWGSRPQHAGAGEGAVSVWQLIAQVEQEARQRERGGRHRLREEPPPSTSDIPAEPALEAPEWPPPS